MTTPTFPDVKPNYGAVKTAEPTIRRVAFSSGYEQRSVVGMNNDPKRWDLTWEHITLTDANSIEDFLEARQGHQKFQWEPPDEVSQTYLWVCEQWSKAMNYPGLFTITATFREVFEP